MLTEDGPLRIEVPRDRAGSFEPILIPKHERRFTGFDDKIVAMYARGMTVREIRGFLAEQYGTDVSPEFISSVTDAVMAEVTAWQSRPLEPMYPVVFFDALRVKIREDAVVRNKAIYLAIGVNMAGNKEVLGLWGAQTQFSLPEHKLKVRLPPFLISAPPPQYHVVPPNVEMSVPVPPVMTPRRSARLPGSLRNAMTCLGTAPRSLPPP